MIMTESKACRHIKKDRVKTTSHGHTDSMLHSASEDVNLVASLNGQAEKAASGKRGPSSNHGGHWPRNCSKRVDTTLHRAALGCQLGFAL